MAGRASPIARRNADRTFLTSTTEFASCLVPFDPGPRGLFRGQTQNGDSLPLVARAIHGEPGVGHAKPSVLRDDHCVGRDRPRSAGANTGRSAVGGDIIGLLFGLSPSDPITFPVVPLLLALVGCGDVVADASGGAARADERAAERLTRSRSEPPFLVPSGRGDVTPHATVKITSPPFAQNPPMGHRPHFGT